MSEQLNILSIISSNLHSGPGVPALQHLKLLKNSGHNVMLICLSGKNLSETAQEQQIEVSTALSLPRNGKIWQLFSDSEKLKKIIAAFSPDLIFVHKTIETLLCGLSVHKKAVPAIRIWHDGSGRRICRAERIMHNFTGIPVIATTQTGSKATRRFSPRGIQPAPYISGAVNTEDFSTEKQSCFLKNSLGLPEKSVIAAIVSRLKPDRELEKFVAALSKAAEKNADLYGVIIGKGEMTEQISAYADKLNVREKMFVFSPEKHFIDAVARIDILVALKPGSDGSARAVPEAMACGKPAVLLAEGSLADFADNLNNKCGAVVENTKDLSAEIVKLAADKNLRKNYGSKAAKTVKEKYSENILERTLNELCRRAVSEKWRL